MMFCSLHMLPQLDSTTLVQKSKALYKLLIFNFMVISSFENIKINAFK